MNSKSILIVAFLIVAAFLTSQNPVKGVWESNEEHKDLIFNGDGTGTWDGSPFEYYVNSETIHAVKDSYEYLFTYQVQDGKLILLDSNTMDAPRTFVKSDSDLQ